MGNAKTTKGAVQQEESADVLPISKEATRNVGCDDGHFGVKLVTEGEDGTLVQTYVPSRVALGAQVISLNDAEDNLYETDNGQSYTVSETLPHIDTRFSDYALSDINRVLVHHALLKAGLAGANVRIVTGLPMNDYFVGSKPNSDFIGRKVKSLMDSKVRNRNPSVKCASIIAHAVQPEAIAAFYDLLINAEGDVNAEIEELVANGAIGVIDIGGKTTDEAVIVNGGKGIDPSRSGTAQIGALSLNVAVEQRLKSEFKVDQLSPVQVEKAVLTGNFRVFGKDNDCSAIINQEKSLLAEQIIAAAKRSMRDAADLEKVFFVGGGSLLLRAQLQDLYPHAVFVEDPQFANARGMFKIAKYIMK